MILRSQYFTYALVCASCIGMLGCSKKSVDGQASTASPQVSAAGSTTSLPLKKNLLAEELGATVTLTPSERTALKRYAEGHARMIRGKMIIGLSPDGHVLRESFAKYELPELLRETQPDHREEIERIARLTMDAIIYAYYIHYSEAKGVAWKEDPVLHKILRFEPGKASTDTPYVLDHMLMVTSDLEDLCGG